MLNDIIRRADIQAGHLTYFPPAPGEGENCDSFLFAADEGSGWAMSPTSMSIHVAAEENQPIPHDEDLEEEELFVVVEEFCGPDDSGREESTAAALRDEINRLNSTNTKN